MLHSIFMALLPFLLVQATIVIVMRHTISQLKSGNSNPTFIRFLEVSSGTIGIVTVVIIEMLLVAFAYKYGIIN